MRESPCFAKVHQHETVAAHHNLPSVCTMVDNVCLQYKFAQLSGCKSFVVDAVFKLAVIARLWIQRRTPAKEFQQLQAH